MEPNPPHKLRPAEATKPIRQTIWSWKVGEIAGIAIRIHATFLLLIAWMLFLYYVEGVSARATGLGLALIVTVFAIVVVHELAHALMARHFGIRTRDITLLPIGGIASLERMPERPSQELAVALVGPAVNIVLAGVLAVFVVAFGGSLDVTEATTIGGAFATQLVWINLGLAAFNLLPAFPMDGGRAVRALLAIKLGRERATDIAALLGKIFAVGMAIVGIMYNPLLALIAIVVWFGASQEATLVHLRSRLAGIPVRDAMINRIDSVAADQPLEDAATLIVSAGQNQIAVVDHGHPVSILTRNDIARGLARSGPHAPVAAAPHHEIVMVAPTESLDAVLDRLREAPDAVALVVDRDVPIGLITADQLVSYASLHRAR
jgi:Zn-dependent protease